MIFKLKKLIPVIGLIIGSMQLTAQTAQGELPVIPKPVSEKIFNGVCQINGNTTIFYTHADLQSSAELLSEIIKGFGFEAPEVVYISKIQPRNGIFLTLDNTIAQEEGYRMTSGKNVMIAGKSARGVFYGVQTLYQLMFANKSATGFSIPCVNITDYPRFPWRGMHLDVSRHFFSKEFIKNILISLHFIK